MPSFIILYRIDPFSTLYQNKIQNTYGGKELRNTINKLTTMDAWCYKTNGKEKNIQFWNSSVSNLN